jgi:methyl-accepting chemotaxis protein
MEQTAASLSKLNAAVQQNASNADQADHAGAAVLQMDQSTQHNAARVEQLAATAAGLRISANEQVRLVSAFTLATNPSFGE